MRWDRRFLFAGMALLATLAPIMATPVQAAAGAVTEFALPATSSPGAITTGPDGNLWFGDAGALGRIGTTGDLTEFAVPGGGTPGWVSGGPDGRLWFTNGIHVGAMTTSGAATEFVLPGDAKGVRQPVFNLARRITAGPDGALWSSVTMFSRTCVCNIGGALDHVTTSGDITQLALPSGGTRRTAAQPHAITTGPDGAIWYGDPNLGVVGRMTTQGSLTTFAVAGATGIAVGRDAALWVTGGGSVNRLTVDGSLKPYPVQADGTNGVSLGDIVAGSDGNLWFGDYDLTTSRGSIIRISTAGDQTRFPFPTLTEIDGLAPGPDGAIWFTGTDRSNPDALRPFVGRLTTS